MKQNNTLEHYTDNHLKLLLFDNTFAEKNI